MDLQKWCWSVVDVNMQKDNHINISCTTTELVHYNRQMFRIQESAY
jgi:hypothetical protein